MPFNGTGIFTRLRSWQADRASGLGIMPDLMDQDADDIALGLSKTLLRDGTAIPTADLPMNNKRLVFVGAPRDAGDALSLGSTPASEITRALGFTPVSGGTSHQVAITYDGTGLTSSVDGNAAFGRVWTANTLTATALNGIAGQTLYGTANFNPASKINADGGATVVGYNAGNTNRPYISGSAYHDLVWCNAGGSYAIGIDTRPMPYFLQPGGGQFFLTRTNGANLISLRWNGSNACVLVDTYEFALQASSDARLKDVQGHVQVPDALKKLAALQPVTFEWNDKYDLLSQRPGRHYGFVAQDLEQVLPTAVQEGAENEDGTQYLQLSPDAAMQVCALLVKANQDLQTRLAAVEARIDG